MEDLISALVGWSPLIAGYIVARLMDEWDSIYHKDGRTEIIEHDGWEYAVYMVDTIVLGVTVKTVVKNAYWKKPEGYDELGRPLWDVEDDDHGYSHQ